MELRILEKTRKYLKDRPEQRFTSRQIAEWILEKYPKECEEKKKNSKATKVPIDTDEALLRLMAAEISSAKNRIKKKEPKIQIVGRPMQFYYTESVDSEESDTAESTLDSTGPTPKRSEADLYPKLSAFLASQNIYSIRIDDKKSSNTRTKGSNKWLHPDVVGLEDLSEGWYDKLKDFVSPYQKSRLWSFEAKRDTLTISNVRESYAQAINNSSWANFGYLVAEGVESETMKELQMLSGLHGIGVIELDAENPAESQIIIPARERTEVDWSTVDRIVKENSDFKKYVEEIANFYKSGRVDPRYWDSKPYKS